MSRRYPQLTFNPSVRDAQESYGSRSIGRRLEAMEYDDQHLSSRETEFVLARDSFYMASVGENGWPYVQFRGGPRGFLRVLDESTLAFADFRGNRQYISTGNLRHDDRAALILVDYTRRQRLKLMVRVEVIDASQRPDLVEQVSDPTYEAKVERVFVLRVEAFDWNCPQHITPRFTAEEMIEQREAVLGLLNEAETDVSKERNPS